MRLHQRVVGHGFVGATRALWRGSGSGAYAAFWVCAWVGADAVAAVGGCCAWRAFPVERLACWGGMSRSGD